MGVLDILGVSMPQERCYPAAKRGREWAAVGPAGQKEARGEEGEERGPGRAVTRVELAAKGGIYGPQ